VRRSSSITRIGFESGPSQHYLCCEKKHALISKRALNLRCSHMKRTGATFALTQAALEPHNSANIAVSAFSPLSVPAQPLLTIPHRVALQQRVVCNERLSKCLQDWLAYDVWLVRITLRKSGLCGTFDHGAGGRVPTSLGTPDYLVYAGRFVSSRSR
jgi:hypothetical protein